MGEPILTPTFRVSFPSVFEARKFGENQEAKYSVTMLFDKDADLSKLKAAAKAAAIEKWGEKLPKGLKTPFRDAADKEHLDGYEAGMIFVRATSTVEPEVLDRNKQPIKSQREFFAGCYARAVVAAFAYDTKGNKGISFGLRAIQKVKDGPGFGAGGSKADMFEDLGDEDSTETAATGTAPAAAAEGKDEMFD